MSEDDVQGFMEAIYDVKERELDLILHSPGGSIAAAEAIVIYLRQNFDHIRAFIPHAAMSAATMIACAADEIYMGRHSFLGPTDPQFVINTAVGPRQVPAQAILQQFERARDECKDPANLTVWLPMLQQYGPDLLEQCENAIELSKELIESWLATYMFKGHTDATDKANNVAKWLANHSEMKSHGRHLGRDRLLDVGLNIKKLEVDKVQQDAILSIFHSVTHTFAHSGSVKLIENHKGNAFINQVQQVNVLMPQPGRPEAFLEVPKRNRESRRGR